MRLCSGFLLAALVAGAAAMEYAPMPTRRAVLRKRQEPACAQDACLSALQQTDLCSCIRQGKEDCSSFFVSTTIPDLVTEYSTSYTTSTISTTASVTSTSVIDTTATQTQRTTTSTSTSTTATRPITSSIRPPSGPLGLSKKKKKRAPSGDLPFYARDVCGGLLAYQSACACMGVFPTVVSAAPSTTTLTTVTSLFPTTSGTVTASTESTTRTVSTQTVTSTSTDVAVSTAVAQGLFTLRVYNYTSPRTSNFTGRYTIATFVDSDPSSYTMGLTGRTESAAATFFIDPDGFLKLYLPDQPEFNDYFWGWPNSPTEYGRILYWDIPTLTSLDFARIHCLVRPETNVLVCGDEAVPDGTTKFGTCAGDSNANLGPDTRVDDTNCVGVILVAVPVPQPGGTQIIAIPR